MSRELYNLIDECIVRLGQLNDSQLMCSTEGELADNHEAWVSTFERLQSLHKAVVEQSKLRYTTKGDFTHLRGIGYVHSSC